ncbi:TPA: conjugal transfer protein [Streptococcus suis]|uniref:TcpE family conjugal transfer membrane protein n=1 Tax=Streptococcus suis TaxID=1307 RepID=UPI0004629A0E|nr:TcpE family conjugal transfer membrane protein [Streptococcus suis]HEL2217797.1 conjugal transfer protein [Streptococcus suis]HEL2459925.1 conjugal transfer protein [Streptococcus suis]HEM3178738.1 conjugal transfer protein [Streptococcus suis 92-4172]
MKETEKREDKKLYSYKQALSQPYWIQKFNDDFSLKQPIKFSRVVYFILIFGLLWILLDKLFSSFSIGLRGIGITMLSLNASAFLSEMVLDGKSVVIYIKDYLLFYFNHGQKSKSQYINKGQVYTKPIPRKMGEK